MMTQLSKMFLVVSIIAFCPTLFAATRVVTSEPNVGWVVKQIGRDLVEVDSLLKGSTNPHYAETVPDFVRKVADAQIVCVVGLDLEVGWMPKILARSGNAKVQPGGPGYCETGKAISVMEKPTGPVDRSMGDVHPAGNPHFWLSPKHFLQSAQTVTDVLIKNDPNNQKKYETAFSDFSKKMTQFYEAQKRKFPKQTQVGILEYHKEFTYFLDAYGLKSIGSLEEKPGVSPSAGRLAEVATQVKQMGTAVMLAAEYSPRKTVERFKELSGATVLILPTAVPSADADYFKFHSELVDSVVAALSTSAVQKVP